jgi:hypothetical protein
MGVIPTLFLIALGIALIALPRSRAPLPLLIGTCYIPLTLGVQLGPFSFPFLRLLILFAFARIIIRNERPLTGLISTDKIVLAWAAWFAASSFFHNDPTGTLVFHLGLIYNTLGIYFAFRCICIGPEHSINLIRLTALVLAPVALEMVAEHLFNHNFFSIFGGVDPTPIVRQGRIRAQGPFSHPILAGTVGGVCFPMMIAIYKVHRGPAIIGAIACLLMVGASASSGPIMSTVFGSLALGFWFFRRYIGLARIAAVVIYLVLEVVMNAPPYYLIAKIDLTGSSTGYHRAALMESAGKHLDEWWFAGTDYTRHWMPYGVSWSEDHADITNHYLGQGVKGGLPLMLLFVAMLVSAFRNAGKSIRFAETTGAFPAFLPWGLGAALFAHAATCISVAYFDQSIVFLNSAIALTACLRAGSEFSENFDTEGFPISDLPDPPSSAISATGGFDPNTTWDTDELPSPEPPGSRQDFR